MTVRSGNVVCLLLTVLSVCVGSTLAQQTRPGIRGSYFPADAVNPGLPEPNEPVNLATPQAAVEHYVLSARRKRWLSAARAMNFRLIGDVSPARARELARNLHYLLKQNLWIDWSRLPDRADGMETGSMLTANDPMAGQARRSITLGTISLDGRDIPIRVERVKPSDGDPVWLFAAQTVDSIQPLYKAKGPSWLARHAPQWSRDRVL